MLVLVLVLALALALVLVLGLGLGLGLGPRAHGAGCHPGRSLCSRRVAQEARSCIMTCKWPSLRRGWFAARTFGSRLAGFAVMARGGMWTRPWRKCERCGPC